MKLQKMKDMLINAKHKALAFAKSLAYAGMMYALVLASILVMSIGILKLPEAHNKYIRASVGSKVYMIRDSKRSGGGTGFAVQGPSGQNYILTNDHVCDVSSDRLTVLVSGDEGSMRRRIIARDENSDLCLVEGLPGVKGLSVASSGPTLGDDLMVVGHPMLKPKHISHGELIGRQDISLWMGPISFWNPQTKREEIIPKEDGGIPAKECQMNKHSQEWQTFDMLFFVVRVKICIMTVKKAYNTAVVIHPGNSGSPVVNFWGNVTGVAFAGDDSNWGYMVSLEDINAFLKNY